MSSKTAGTHAVLLHESDLRFTVEWGRRLLGRNTERNRLGSTARVPGRRDVRAAITPRPRADHLDRGGPPAQARVPEFGHQGTLLP
jgi:hypothetical protein